MKPGYIYKLNFPYEERQGAKKRPVLIIVISDDNDQALGLKITGTERYNRIPIKNSPDSGLVKDSHVQIDRYQLFYNVQKTEIGRLSAYDFKRVVNAFQEFHDL
ncbi:type II toxin-antitoxin system PemK/MazF family toxin [Virgibacillus salexigens]|uniref:PemK-like protein n=1 Tax=Virgibacillus massiliensis TaxID=1462526 RepID=A0A024QHI1_9BACI|nr:type II toxin-antitoxin system PemK/MazF family toxin [Virgibacillus massiliensis]CDQ41949.1 PemK-like protein [Virgibacillus massiliensis]